MFTYKDYYVKQEYHRENLRNAEHRHLVREATSAERDVLGYLYATARDLVQFVFTGVRPQAQEVGEDDVPLATIQRQR